ncbi:MAG: hypothetical protein RDU25_03190 [Patescibacteria group bacterium]|nr:hypothetical protein [Patescibacteria group bacterium]
MLKTHIDAIVFKRPRLVYTINSPEIQNPRSIEVIEASKVLEKDPDVAWQGCEFRVFASQQEADAVLSNGHNHDEAIALFDATSIRGHFKYVARGRQNHIPVPDWAQRTVWGVAIGEPVTLRQRTRSCAEQLRANFTRRFEPNLDQGAFPWGQRKKAEPAPTRIKLPEHAPQLIERLNQGPDLAEGAVNAGHGHVLPKDSRISWIRVPIDVAEYPKAVMQKTLDTFAAFERACQDLVDSNPAVQEELLVGVELDASLPRLRDCYLQPRNGETRISEWSVRRPDMHVNERHLIASENDEMPGGFADLAHVDMAYDINQEAWTWCFDWLTSEGSLLFVVSDDWSAPYITVTKWLAEEMRRRGFAAHMVTTSELDRVEIRKDGVFLDGHKVGTIWRQFPVFETTGKLAELVFAAQDGLVRMVPEFAHYGSKTWFSLFWRYEEFFAERLTAEDIEIIHSMIPQSHLVAFERNDFPFTVAGKRIRMLEDLISLDIEGRDKLVLKITGANRQSARSYGVFMGHARNEQDWRAWLLDRIKSNEPFIVQQRFETSIETLGVWNTSMKAAEVFRCRVLLRPWVVGGRLISSHNCCTPSYTTKIHGMTDMAVQPVEYV